MNSDALIFKTEERVQINLRTLYSSYGYSQYKMSKFEEYDLYVKNKDFLVAGDMITFTDASGKLMALKPDVTMSIIKNSTEGETLRKVFSYIILDISANIDPNSLKILDKSDMILFTTIVNIPAIRNAQRCLTLFDSRKYNKNKVKIIINRYMENDEIKIEDIETVLDRKIYWKIPNNYFSIMEAINKGVPVNKVNSSSNITENFRELAEKISNEFVEDTILKNRGK